MNRQDFMDTVNKAEEQYPVEKWIINDIHIWPIIRLSLYFQNADEFKINKKSKEANREVFASIIRVISILTGGLRFGYSYLKDFRKNSKPNSQADAVFLSDGISYIKLKDTWYEKYCDPLASLFNVNKLSYFLMTPFNKYFIPRNSPSMFIQPYIDYIKIKNALYFKIHSPEDDKLDKFDDFVDYLKVNKLYTNLSDLKKIKMQAHQIINIARFYIKMFRKTKPSICFSVGYYGNEGFALNLACRVLKIPSVDIQHGFQGDFHPAYGRWNRVPDKGYELLPKIFWCWSNYEATTINGWNKNHLKWHEPLVGGNPFLHLWQPENDDDIINYYDDKIIKIKNCCLDLKHVLYTIGGDEEYDELNKIIEIAKNTEKSFHWWFRLHPNYLNQKHKINAILRDNKIISYELDAATDFPLFAVLRHIDVHLTYFSSTVIEAELFGVPSVVMHKYGPMFFPEQFLSGWAIPAKTTNEIISAIEHQIGKKNFLKENKISQNMCNTEKAIAHLLKLIKENNKEKRTLTGLSA
ncbi:MAG: hypothetical protein NT010_03025 [Proteobacteria bacterium]|nr:hypothetical protein [Pseudomonadota bacterium]